MSIYKVAFTISFNSNAIVKAEHNFFLHYIHVRNLMCIFYSQLPSQ